MKNKYYKTLQKQELMKINETLEGKREKICKRIIELSKEDAKSDSKKLSLSQYSNSRKSFMDVDPDILALFPQHFLKRDSELSLESIRSSQFKTFNKFNKIG